MSVRVAYFTIYFTGIFYQTQTKVEFHLEMYSSKSRPSFFHDMM